MNNGHCIPNGNTYACKCQTGYTGLRCETRDPCSPNPVIIKDVNKTFC